MSVRSTSELRHLSPCLSLKRLRPRRHVRGAAPPPPWRTLPPHTRLAPSDRPIGAVGSRWSHVRTARGCPDSCRLRTGPDVHHREVGLQGSAPRRRRRSGLVPQRRQPIRRRSLRQAASRRRWRVSWSSCPPAKATSRWTRTMGRRAISSRTRSSLASKTSVPPIPAARRPVAAQRARRPC
jgi:hypothetical protein